MVWIIIGWLLRVLGAGLPIVGVVSAYRRAAAVSKPIRKSQGPRPNSENPPLSAWDIVSQTMQSDMEDRPRALRRDVVLIVVGIVLGFAGDVFLSIR